MGDLPTSHPPGAGDLSTPGGICLPTAHFLKMIDLFREVLTNPQPQPPLPYTIIIAV